MLEERLPKKKRLLKSPEFQSVFKKGRRLQTDVLLLAARSNQLGFSRLGISVSKKTGKAVVRNRVKRYIREAFRRDPHIDCLSQDIVTVLKSQGESIDFACIRDEMESLIYQLAMK